VVVREGSGSGEAKGFSLGQAHELALKSAETDATKRALASFGNSFGLALYDPEQNGIKRGSAPKDESPPAPLALYSAAGEVLTVFDNPKAFAQALHQAMLDAGHVMICSRSGSRMSKPCGRCIGSTAGTQNLGSTALRWSPT
jgi:hypothetical protein